MSEPLTFVSYASPDRERVQKFCDSLKSAGYPIWVDYEQIKPGQNWDFEISSALARADFVLFFVSAISVDRRGYVQRELGTALDRLKERLIDDIFLIPVLLDDGIRVPMQLRNLQHISASRVDCLDQIRAALDHQISRLGLQRREALAGRELQWSTETFRESWEGSPGYQFRADFISLTSYRYKNLDHIGHYIRGKLVDAMFAWRASTQPQRPGGFMVSLPSSYDATVGKPSLVSQVISIPYTFYWYGSGAAHPNQNFNVFNFILEPLSRMPALQVVLGGQEAALALIQSLVRDQLLTNRLEDGSPTLERDWVERGTLDWDAFSTHEYLVDGIRFLFPPYQVGPYAVGPFSAKVPYTVIVAYMDAEHRRLLGLDSPPASGIVK